MLATDETGAMLSQLTEGMYDPNGTNKHLGERLLFQQLYASKVAVRSDYLPLSACQQASEEPHHCDSADSVWKHLGKVLVEHVLSRIEE
jgi:hypothetical protein